jgi:hypothetical protein
MIVLPGYFGIAIPALLITLYFIKSFYLRTSRQLCILDLEAKAPIYIFSVDVLSGLLTIRAYKRARNVRVGESPSPESVAKAILLTVYGTKPAFLGAGSDNGGIGSRPYYCGCLSP